MNLCSLAHFNGVEREVTIEGPTTRKVWQLDVDYGRCRVGFEVFSQGPAGLVGVLFNHFFSQHFSAVFRPICSMRSGAPRHSTTSATPGCRNQPAIGCNPNATTNYQVEDCVRCARDFSAHSRTQSSSSPASRCNTVCLSLGFFASAARTPASESEANRSAIVSSFAAARRIATVKRTSRSTSCARTRRTSSGRVLF